MEHKIITLISRAKQNLERSMASRRMNHEVDWPDHSLLCNCNGCLKQEFNYIKEMRKEQRLKKQKATR
jgi:hypothetical protein